jgi:hypothetical protein
MTTVWIRHTTRQLAGTQRGEITHWHTQLAHDIVVSSDFSSSLLNLEVLWLFSCVFILTAAPISMAPTALFLGGSHFIPPLALLPLSWACEAAGGWPLPSLVHLWDLSTQLRCVAGQAVCGYALGADGRVHLVRVESGEALVLPLSLLGGLPQAFLSSFLIYKMG